MAFATRSRDTTRTGSKSTRLAGCDGSAELLHATGAVLPGTRTMRALGAGAWCCCFGRWRRFDVRRPVHEDTWAVSSFFGRSRLFARAGTLTLGADLLAAGALEEVSF